MPMVGGKKYPYTEKGKKDAKKAAVSSMIGKMDGKGPRKKKQNWSGVKSQISAGSGY
jgi:hypothetical protein